MQGSIFIFIYALTPEKKYVHVKNKIKTRNNKSSLKMEMTGIDPATYRMQSDRSTIWATSPLFENGFKINYIIFSMALKSKSPK